MRVRRPISPLRGAIALLFALVLLAIGGTILLLRPHENRVERQARRVTEALRAGSLGAVAFEFAPSGLASLTPASLAEASRRLAPLGALRRLHDVTPSGAPPGTHDLVAEFANGSVPEHLRYAPGGLIVSFGYDAPK